MKNSIILKKNTFLDQQLRVMGSDWDKNKNQNTYLQTTLNNQELESSTFIKKLPGYDDVNIFLIQEHFKEKLHFWIIN